MIGWGAGWSALFFVSAAGSGLFLGSGVGLSGGLSIIVSLLVKHSAKGADEEAYLSYLPITGRPDDEDVTENQHLQQIL